MQASSTTADQKASLRTAALARRDAMPAAERQAAAETIAARPFPVAIAPGTIVSGFMPLKSEINPLPLLRKLAEAGAQLALPAIAGRGKPLDHARLEIRRSVQGRPMGHSRTGAGGAGGRSRRPDRAARLLRPRRPPHRLRRRLLRHDHPPSARAEENYRHRHRFRRAGNPPGSGHGTRRAARSRANGKRNHRFPRA